MNLPSMVEPFQRQQRRIDERLDAGHIRDAARRVHDPYPPPPNNRGGS